MNNNPWTDRITTSTEFNAALAELLVAAEKNNVDLRGSWVANNDDEGLTNWEVVVYELDN
ncbi:hypothetical protein HKK80_09590 [Halonotius sp. F2-221B]|uniref:hypothetical protein n=1 Tax=Halonotius sp. F2-221B TaxID=2731620 RepID=UPI00398A65DA